MTRILPTDKHNHVYYGPRTYAEAEAMIDEGSTPQDVAAMLTGAGYTGVAARVKREWGTNA